MIKALLFVAVAVCAVPGSLRGEEVLEDAKSFQILSVHDCVRRAIRENADLKSERLNVLIGEEQILTELAVFAWNLEAAAAYENRDKPQNAREASATNSLGSRVFGEENYRGRVALTKRLTSGGTFEVGSRYARLEDDLTRDSLRSIFSPEHEFFVGVTLTQPLLRGFGKKSTLAKVDLANLQKESARMLTTVKAMNLVAEVAARYTDVVAAHETLGVKSQNIQRAELMVDRNKARVESGKGVENEVLTAELAVFQRKDDYLTTQAEKVERLNSLAGLINLGPGHFREGGFVPVSGFGPSDKLPDRDELIDAAIRSRVDLEYYRTVIDSAHINIRRARDGAKPSLNLVGSAGLHGLDADSGGAIGEAIDDQGQEYTLGLEFRMELGNQSGKSAVEIAKLQLNQAELGYGKARLTISLEVDSAYSRVLNARQRLETAKKARDLAKRNLEAEELLLEQSKGDLYRVIERQQLYGDANANVVKASALVSKSMVALWLASGQLFEKYGISEEWVQTTVEIQDNAK